MPRLEPAAARALGVQVALVLATRAASRKRRRVPALAPALAAALAFCSSDPRVHLAALAVCGAVPLYDASYYSYEADDSPDWPALAAMALGTARGHLRAALVILVMVTGGEALEEYAMNKASKSLELLASAATARLDARGTVIPTSEVAVGDALRVLKSEIVPVDGVLISNEDVLIDESLLTGEAAAVRKTRGDVVLGGCVNVGNNSAVVEATKEYSNSLVCLLKTHTANALESTSPIQLSAKRAAAMLNPLTLGFCAVAYLYHRDLDVVLSILMAATPCPAAIGVPVAMLSGMSVATRRFGVSVKSASSLELLRDIDVVIFDKTGTLTTASLSVASHDDAPWYLLASAEQHSTHPLAKAIVNHHIGKLSRNVVDVVQAPQGIEAVVDGELVRVGSADHCRMDVASGDSTTGVTSECYFRVGTTHSGRIVFSDALRASARATVTELKRRGFRVMMLTGDQRAECVSAVSKALRIDEHRTCWPHEKALVVEELLREGRTVMMVGDGDNDAAALAAASVGVSLRNDNAASSVADLVLTRPDDLHVLCELIDVSHRTMEIATNTAAYGTAASVLQMACAATFATSPLRNAIAQECVDLLSILYALRALQ